MSSHFLLSGFSATALRGSDARAYAQSQFSANADEFVSSHYSPLAWCDPKGRVLAFMLACADDSGINLVLPAAQAETIRNRLAQFTIGRKVEVAPLAPVAATFDAGSGVPRLSPDSPRGMFAGTQAPLSETNSARWLHQDICAGLPWLSPATSGQHLPQWLGLEQLGALSWDKGCYPGQEIVARLHYRGSVKHGLQGLRLESAKIPEGHSRIVDSAGKLAGHWLYGMPQGQKSIGLAVLANRLEAGDTVMVEADAVRVPARVVAPTALC